MQEKYRRSPQFTYTGSIYDLKEYPTKKGFAYSFKIKAETFIKSLNENDYGEGDMHLVKFMKGVIFLKDKRTLKSRDGVRFTADFVVNKSWTSKKGVEHPEEIGFKGYELEQWHDEELEKLYLDMKLKAQQRKGDLNT